MEDVTITDVQTYIVSNPWVFVELEIDASVTGLTEATTHDKPRTVAATGIAITKLLPNSDSSVRSWPTIELNPRNSDLKE